jgi:hypothetical protein
MKIILKNTRSTIKNLRRHFEESTILNVPLVIQNSGCSNVLPSIVSFQLS